MGGHRLLHRHGVPHHGVRGGGDALPLLVFQPFGGQTQYLAGGGEDLQRLTRLDPAPLGALGHPVLPGFHHTHKLPVPDIAALPGVLAGVLPAEEKSGRIPPVTDTGQFVQHRVRALEVVRRGQERIQRLPVGTGHAGHIVHRFGAALDLQAVGSGLADQVNKGRHTQIVGVQDVAAALILPDLHKLAGAGLLHQMVFPAAGLGALAPVGIPFGQILAEQAPAGHAHAHGPVHKHLQFQFPRGFGPDGGDVLQGQFPGQHHPLGPQLKGGGGGGVVGNAHLGGEMDFHIRGQLLHHPQHAQIGHDKAVHARRPGIGDGLGQPVQFGIGGQGVQGQVNPLAPGVGKDAALLQLGGSKVIRRGPHPEFGQGGVHRVRPVADGILQPFQVPGGGQQFRSGHRNAPLG